MDAVDAVDAVDAGITKFLGFGGGEVSVAIQIALEALGDLSAIHSGNVSQITRDAMTKYPEHAAEIGMVSMWLVGDMLCPSQCVAATQMKTHLFNIIQHLEACLDQGPAQR